MYKPPDLPMVVSKNIRFFMHQDGFPYKNARALALVAKVSPNTVRNLLDPKKRTVTVKKQDGYPTLDTLEAIAPYLGCEVWELLHPDIEKSRKETAMYRQIEASFKDLPPDRIAEDEKQAAQGRPVVHSSGGKS